MEHVRQMPGRIAGVAHDAAGRKGYVMSLQAREQHIRRERATSNICSNQMHAALAATIYLSLVGPDGFRKIAQNNFVVAHQLADQLARLPGCSLAYPHPFFNEFVLNLPDAGGGRGAGAVGRRHHLRPAAVALVPGARPTRCCSARRR